MYARLKVLSCNTLFFFTVTGDSVPASRALAALIARFPVNEQLMLNAVLMEIRLIIILFVYIIYIIFFIIRFYISLLENKKCLSVFGPCMRFNFTL